MPDFLGEKTYVMYDTIYLVVSSIHSPNHRRQLGLQPEVVTYTVPALIFHGSLNQFLLV